MSNSRAQAPIGATVETEAPADAAPSDGRRFNDKEVKRLLARAVELAQSSEDRPAPREGTTLVELERVAAEAGLPPEALRRALAELESAAPEAEASALRRFLGAQTYRTELILDKAPSRQELERLLLVLPDVARLPGSGSVTDDSLVWRSEYTSQSSSGIKRRVEISARAEGGALIKVEADPTLAALGSYVGIVAGLGITGVCLAVPLGLALLHSPSFAALVSAASIVASALLARGVMALVSSTIRKKARRLVEEISRRLSRG